MKYIKEYNSFQLNEGDNVIIHYWYNNMITPVQIVSKKGNKYLVSHDVDGSKINNAPNELVSKSDIIDNYRI